MKFCREAIFLWKISCGFAVHAAETDFDEK